MPTDLAPNPSAAPLTSPSLQRRWCGRVALRTGQLLLVLAAATALVAFLLPVGPMFSVGLLSGQAYFELYVQSFLTGMGGPVRIGILGVVALVGAVVYARALWRDWGVLQGRG